MCRQCGDPYFISDLHMNAIIYYLYVDEESVEQSNYNS